MLLDGKSGGATIGAGPKSVRTRPDPTKEVCRIPVKIADLGNACWTVGTIVYNYP